MKSASLILFALGIASLSAADPKPAPVRITTADAFALRPPDENSPFFLSSGIAPPSRETIAEYPKARTSEESAPKIIGKFFAGMFSSVKIGPFRTPPDTTTLTVDPKKISLADRREVNVTYTVRNNTKKLQRIEYPGGQRIEILTSDGQGRVVDRWSDDRTFDTNEGIVILNPKERLEYQEKIPTREMKPGQQYKIEVKSVGKPGFEAIKAITPE